MAVSRRLDGYLALERIMLELDEVGDPLGEQIRDAMDPLWYGLVEEERTYLNERSIEVRSLHPVTLSISGDIFFEPSRDSGQITLIDAGGGVGKHFTDWKRAA